MKIGITNKLKKTKEMEYLDWTGVNGGGEMDWRRTMAMAMTLERTRNWRVEKAE